MHLRTRQSLREQWIPISIIALMMNVLVIGVSQIEHLNVNGGLGWDGRTYSYLARQFPGLLNSHRIDYYIIQRLLPSAIINVASRILHKELTNEFLIMAFRVLDIVLINVAFFFTAIAMLRLGIRGRALVLALIFTFCNVFVLKALLYAPINTDAAGLALGCVLLYAYVSRKPWLSISVGLLGAFTHPLLLSTSLFLYVFRKEGARNDEVAPLAPALLRFIPYAVAGVFCLTYTLLYILRNDAITRIRVEYATAVNMRLYFPSVLFASLYLFTLCRFVVSFRVVERLIRELRWKNILIAAGILAFVVVSQVMLCGSESRYGPHSFLLNLMVSGIRYPLQFVVAHISFWGLGVLIIILLFRQYLSAVQGIGSGYLALILGLCLAGINSETRQYSFALPFLMAPIGLVLSRFSLAKLHVYGTALIALMLSKFWLVIGAPDVMSDIQHAPFQRYFLSIGPWIAPRSYAVQFVLFVLLGIAIYFVVRKRLALLKQAPGLSDAGASWV